MKSKSKIWSGMPPAMFTTIPAHAEIDSRYRVNNYETMKTLLHAQAAALSLEWYMILQVELYKSTVSYYWLELQLDFEDEEEEEEEESVGSESDSSNDDEKFEDAMEKLTL